MAQVGHRLALGHARKTKTRDVSQTGPTVNKAHVAAFVATEATKRAAQENTKKRTHYIQSVWEEGRGGNMPLCWRAYCTIHTYRESRDAVWFWACASHKRRERVDEGEKTNERAYKQLLFLLAVATNIHTLLDSFGFVWQLRKSFLINACLYESMCLLES